MWKDIREEVPEVDQDVMYYFELLGKFPGKYLGKEGSLHVFGGRYGFLTGDVTHWKPLDGSDKNKKTE